MSGQVTGSTQGVRGYVVELSPGVWACGREHRTLVRDGATFYFSERRARRALAEQRRGRDWPHARIVPVVVRLIPVDDGTGAPPVRDGEVSADEPGT